MDVTQANQEIVEAGQRIMAISRKAFGISDSRRKAGNARRERHPQNDTPRWPGFVESFYDSFYDGRAAQQP